MAIADEGRRGAVCVLYSCRLTKDGLRSQKLRGTVWNEICNPLQLVASLVAAGFVLDVTA